ncbi:hypothetical protein M9979_12475 [Sphingomonas sp. RP10(2022)]|uniref:Uncharacterized protein n=1 Tax=Sphingomonas liriopis TaxID=2949094 RepID=A0A9X2HUE0_9SPHN|nr:hypothetical protein [Sphingomonas liriopis]MCP3735689.1 hypothetical protein [Sphingomonas liriopis]
MSLSEPQHARFHLKAGKRVRLVADVTVTNGGLLAIGALVSSILLSSAVIVKAARQDRLADR